jgi:two-component system, chemotaxis family, sensor kinase CheA
MPGSEADFLATLLATFREEAAEHVQTMADGLMALEAPAPADGVAVLHRVFRAAHSLKGAARAVNQKPVEELCQELEGVCARLEKAALLPEPALLDVMHRGLSLIENCLASPAAAAPPEHRGVRQELRGLAAALPGGRPFGAVPVPVPVSPSVPVSGPASVPSPPSNDPPAAGHSPDTLRIQRDKLDAVLHLAEELVAVKLGVRQQTAELWAVAETTPRGSGDTASRTAWEEHRQTLQRLASAARRDARTTDRMVDRLLEEVKSLRLLPFAAEFGGMPKMVRDLARTLGKELEFEFDGMELEADRRILQAVKDPLIHLLRNAVDHGIELPEVRRAAGKPPRGWISLRVSQVDAGRLVIRIADDGAGLRLPLLRAAAVRLGLMDATQAEQATPAALRELMFTPGFTTSPAVTDLSGRGLGLAIVREKVREVGGSATVLEGACGGTEFVLDLPVTLASFRGVLVRAGGRTLAVPTRHVERALWVTREAILRVENQPVVMVQGQPVVVRFLAEILDLRRPPEAGATTHLHLLVLHDGVRRAAFVVEAILHEQELLAKGLGPQLVRVRHLAGAAVLGDGEVVPILNVPDLLGVVTAVDAASRGELTPVGGAPAPARILVAEDSITSRILLKNVLETAGYGVAVAVDGADAWAQLRQGKFALVVSDVDMPRMNGFVLTSRIRAEARLAELPVILVTSLDSAEDRERGIEAGANAYLVKSSFDQGNLLSVIRELL